MRQAVDRRLARIEGQVAGLRRMVSEGKYCVDILTQLAAVRSALDQAGAEMAACHVKTCIVGHGSGTEHEHSKPMSQEDLIDELRVTLSRLMR
ncbi:MAG TPA: metal-sensitive transcriptional regulator [Fimbriimonadaceae bacterium]|nr:metal-sensitive transcriptional regulator [Fimbriimonadaceae bacterium]